MSLIQITSLGLAIVAISLNVRFLLTFWGKDRVSALKSLLILTWLLHVVLFYTCLLFPELRKVEISFTLWSRTLRLHGIVVVLIKEFLAFLQKKAVFRQWNLL